MVLFKKDAVLVNSIFFLTKIFCLVIAICDRERLSIFCNS